MKVVVCFPDDLVAVAACHCVALGRSALGYVLKDGNVTVQSLLVDVILTADERLMLGAAGKVLVTLAV